MGWGNGDGITLEQMETETHFCSLFSSSVKEKDHLVMKCLRQTCQKVLRFVGGGRRVVVMGENKAAVMADGRMRFL